MDKSVFEDKTRTPSADDLVAALGKTWPLWTNLRDYILGLYPRALESWNYGGEKYGWSYRISNKRRVIIYLLPRSNYFLVAFGFGEKATQAALTGNISQPVKDIIASAKVYAEGRGFRIEVRDDGMMEDIRELVRLKLAW